ncbi:SdpI family protein [Microcoleus sp. FACHB-1515]|uniref:SdpI family protein n=1 Tax=Cyanophyceae TaxID=3028117 RepID=UPI001681E3D6|nr:SdpI family protein [Microcoleus sp. FACHB-1515]MBD2092856.1 SdpI family protein [Microcoleus sp. FACHB-1515]
MLLWLLTGLLFIGLSLPLILKKVPPNRWYGFRVAKTFSSELIWYAANRAAGYGLLGVGVAIALTAAATNQLTHSAEAANAINLTVFGVALTIAVIHSFSTLKRL